MTDRIKLILDMTEEDILHAKVAYRLRALVSRAGAEGIRQATAYNKCGLGVTAEQFNAIAEGLADSGWCSRKRGRTEGSFLLTINPCFKDVNVPEWEDKTA